MQKYIGSKLKQARESRHPRISQRALGIAAGIPKSHAQQTVFKYEKGLLPIPSHMLFQFAMILHHPVDFFFPINLEGNGRQNEYK